MTFHEQIQQLTLEAIRQIETHYYMALESEHGSGDHWILMTVLDKFGFRTNSPTKAMEIADDIISNWYNLQR